jgi:hypothetical protein
MNIVKVCLSRAKRSLKTSSIIANWKAAGEPLPPPHFVKQATVREYAQKYTLKTFVETGTYLGDMVFAMRNRFSRIESIELDGSLYRMNRLQFSLWRHITIHHGDSAKVLPTILDSIDQASLFWLDGHYSGGITAKGRSETPIIEELTTIARHAIKSHVILIDDARLFNGKADYPTEDCLKSLIIKLRPDWEIFLENDIFRILSCCRG